MRIIPLWLATACLAFAQLDADTITIAASVSAVAPAPGNVTVSLSVYAIPEIGFDAILQALAGTGVSERNLVTFDPPTRFVSCVPTNQGCASATFWSFQFPAPLSKVTETLATLKNVSAAAPSGMQIGYSIYSDSFAPATTPECAYPTLVSQARRHAENVAAAAGLRVGAVIALSDGTGAEVAGMRVGIPSAAYAVFDPLVGVSFAPFQPTAPPACSTIVQFKLLR